MIIVPVFYVMYLVPFFYVQRPSGFQVRFSCSIPSSHMEVVWRKSTCTNSMKIDKFFIPVSSGLGGASSRVRKVSPITCNLSCLMSPIV